MPFSVEGTQCYTYGYSSQCLANLSSVANDFFTSIGVDRNSELDLLAVVAGQYNSEVGGFATLGGDVSLSYMAIADTLIHEIGHNLGLGHANRYNSDGSTKEYGDNSTVMGSGNTRRVNAPELERLNLHNPFKWANLTETKKFILSPIEYPDSVLSNRSVQAVLVSKNSTETIYVSARAGSEVPFGNTSPDIRNGVSVHRVRSVEPSRSYRIDVLQPGESLSVNGSKIHFLGFLSENEYEVDVYYNSNDPAPDFSDIDDSYRCTGYPPLNSTMCSSDDINLIENTPVSLVSSCTSSKKCEYQCKGGFKISDDGLSCIDETVDNSGYYCSGNIPENSVLCPGDADDLTKIWNKKLTSTCTSQTKCEYVCKSGYKYQYVVLVGGQCVPDSSSGTGDEEISITINGLDSSQTRTFYSGDQLNFQVSGLGDESAAKGWAAGVDKVTSNTQFPTCPVNNDEYVHLSGSTTWNDEDKDEIWEAEERYETGPNYWKMIIFCFMNESSGSKGAIKIYVKPRQ